MDQRGALAVLSGVARGIGRARTESADTCGDIAARAIRATGVGYTPSTINTIAMAVFVLAFLGMPLAGGMGFFAKWYILQAALQASSPQTVLAVVLVLASAVSASYYLAVVAAMFMRPRPEGHAVPSTTPFASVLIAAMAIVLIVLGVYPTPVARMARAAMSPQVSADSVRARPAPRATPLSTASAPR